MSQALHYRPLSCQRVTGFARLWPLARQEMTALFRTKWGVALFFVCLFPSLGRLVMLLIMFGVVDFGPRGLRDRMSQNLPPNLDHLNPERAAFYFETALSTMPGMVFFLMLTSMSVARSIARDRATNGLELYWTRGISPWGYVFAKWLGGFLITATLTVLMPLLLWIAAGFLAEDWTLLADTSGQVVIGLLGLVIMTAIWTGIGTLLSAVANSANLAMVMWAMLLVGSSAIGFVLSKALREPELRSCLSFWDAGRVVVRDLASLPQRDVSVFGAYAMLVTVATVLVVLAQRRMRVVEALQ
ncbi:MAG: ABC transporter permease [Planctomycetota bacterium]|jgi:ABC-type transport system involved in multi-copper enzyme maturation permease subunit